MIQRRGESAELTKRRLCVAVSFIALAGLTTGCAAAVVPFVGFLRELKTWISEETGPEASIEALMSTATYFGLSESDAATVLGQVERGVVGWRDVAASLGFTSAEVDSFADAFEHQERAVAFRPVLHECVTERSNTATAERLKAEWRTYRRTTPRPSAWSSRMERLQRPTHPSTADDAVSSRVPNSS